MTSYKFRGIVTALTSITHNGGQVNGTEALLRRELFIQENLAPLEVPVISGNGIRGKLRDVGMIHMLRSLGYGENGKGTNLPAFHFLLSGGALTSTGGKAIRIAEARRLQHLIPLVGIFGGGVGNGLLHGILDCGKMIPIAQETRHLIPWLPEPFKSMPLLPSVWDWTQKEMYTRKDDSKDARKRDLLSDATRKLLEAAEDAKQNKPANAPQEKNDGATTQMMMTVETLAAGSKFAWELILRDPTPLELDAFMTCLVQFSAHPFIGGKASVGHGQISVDFSNWIKIDSSTITGQEVAMPAGTLYAKHLKDSAKDIRSTLEAWQ